MALVGEEYFPNVAEGVSAAVELADELDATYGFFIEKTLTRGAFAGGLDKSEHHVVLEGLSGDAGFGGGAAYAGERGCSAGLVSFSQCQLPGFWGGSTGVSQLSHQASKRRI